ncbi:hypothetical protein GCM10020331_038130 [Ectobacillus funiculus]
MEKNYQMNCLLNLIIKQKELKLNPEFILLIKQEIIRRSLEDKLDQKAFIIDKEKLVD